MEIQFTKDGWDPQQLIYAYSWRFEETPVFLQEADCIRNQENPQTRQGFDNIALLSGQPLGPGTTVRTRCAFHRFGAPLIVLAEHLDTDDRGVVRFGNYLEIVLYEDGINVWRMWHTDGKVSWKKLMSVDFPVSAGETHLLSVTAETERLLIQADNRKMSLYIPDLYPSWYGGICACEGINRFYSLSIIQSNGSAPLGS